MGNLDFVAIDLETATSHRNSICEYNRQIKKFPTEKQNVSLKHILT